MDPVTSQPITRRSSKRLLEARRFSRINDTRDSSTTEIFANDTPIITKVPIAISKATLLSCGGVKKSTLTHATTYPSRLIKRERFTKEQDNKPAQVEVHHANKKFLQDKGLDMALTEIAAMAKNHEDNDTEDEVASSYNPDFVTVGKYSVKAEFASLVSKIIKEYGDIAQNCFMTLPHSRSRFMETVCDILQKLQGKTLETITTSDVDFMLKQVADLENVRFQVEWLSKYLRDSGGENHAGGGRCW